ncbi:hypothetical protein TSYNTROPHJE_00990 [Tepidanaerobacter syntrophicus]|nr:hypothetical protein TSYNTROPHJE_00990 [Tepidanaerobacter syntrophicus]
MIRFLDNCSTFKPACFWAGFLHFTDSLILVGKNMYNINSAYVNCFNMEETKWNLQNSEGALTISRHLPMLVFTDIKMGYVP